MLADLAPVFAAHVVKLAVRRPIAFATFMAEVVYEDGAKDTLELDNEGIVDALVAEAKRTPTKGEKAKPNGKGKAKANGTPTNGEVKEKTKVITGRWLNMDTWIGVCDYKFKTTGWKEVAILADEGDTWKLAIFCDTQYGRAVPPHFRRMHPKKTDTNVRNVRLWKPKAKAA